MGKKLLDDRELFRKIAEGDAGAYRALFDLYYDRLRYNAIKFLKSEFWAEEVAQETFLQLWDDREKLSDVEHPAGWLYRVVSFKCINLLRQQERAVKVQYALQLSADAAHTSQRNNYDLERIRKLVNEAIGLLPEQQRRVYLLRQEEGYSYKDIAARFGISAHTVHNHLARSVQSIRNHLLSKSDLTFTIIFLFFFDLM